MTDPESESLARKVSCKLSLRWPREVGAVAGSGLWQAMGVRAQVWFSQDRLAEGEVGTQPSLCQWSGFPKYAKVLWG